MHLRTNFVDCVTCTYFKKLFIGETGRRLGDRFREYLRHSERNDKNASKPVARHFHLPNHSQQHTSRQFGKPGKTRKGKCSKRQLLNSLRWPIYLISPVYITKSPYKFVGRELVPRVLFVLDDGKEKMSHGTSPQNKVQFINSREINSLEDSPIVATRTTYDYKKKKVYSYCFTLRFEQIFYQCFFVTKKAKSTDKNL